MQLSRVPPFLCLITEWLSTRLPPLHLMSLVPLPRTHAALDMDWALTSHSPVGETGPVLLNSGQEPLQLVKVCILDSIAFIIILNYYCFVLQRSVVPVWKRLAMELYLTALMFLTPTSTTLWQCTAVIQDTSLRGTLPDAALVMDHQ